ncbi:unnamed protein product [Rhizoctonia solani]|uniref:Uncharacterized protein n=1 Tax=Rhizoctonia solani TaxID=456999 RepID=A0A8H3CMZ5_9AGAM|nr:unnamed protein product [Rhizoctonia solani]
MDQMAQMQAMLRAMEDRLSTTIAQSEQRTTAQITQLSDRVNETNTRIDQTNTRINQMNTPQTVATHDARALARSLNSASHSSLATLHSLPLPDGSPPPDGLFPENYGAFRLLEAGAPLQQLLQLYQIEVSPGALLDDRLRILATYCGISW